MRFARAARLAGRITGPAAMAAAVALLAGCGGRGGALEALGLRADSPDEFQVIQYEPPVVPQTFDLPEPTPGAPSPRAPDPEQQAVAALLGTDAARVRQGAAGPTPGEERLLASADAASASGDIRVQLEQDLEERPGEPYEPPTLWELFGFGSDDEAIDETQVIDPDQEAERLQAQGIPTPVDPEAAERAAAEAEEPEPAPENLDRRPSNRIGPPIEPAF